MEPCGYVTGSGYVGYIGKDRWQFFPTEQEYLDYIKEFNYEAE